MATTTNQATKTGHTVNVWGTILPEVDQVLGEHDKVCVDGVYYYTHDMGGFIVGSRTATSEDYGGNPIPRGTRTAPQPLDGMAAKRDTRPTRIKYSEPEIVGAGHRN